MELGRKKKFLDGRIIAYFKGELELELMKIRTTF